MRFGHAPTVWAHHPTLAVGVISTDAITPDADVTDAVARYTAIARARDVAESELPQVQAWRRAFAAMGLKPTQYRSAAEALLRRVRKDGALPRIHPLVDLANAVSVAYAVPVAVLDRSRLTGDVEVRPALGRERYETFAGEIESPAPGEIVYVDDDDRAHARRWTNRQSGYSAVREATTSVLIVVEALHADATVDVAGAVTALGDGIAAAWGVVPLTAILTAAEPTVTLA